MRPTICALLALAPLTLTACGGASDEADPSATRQQFIAKTDKLCKASNARTSALNLEVADADARARNDVELLRLLAPILKRGYGSVRDNAAAFQSANPPAADAARIERIRKAYDEQAELARKLEKAANAGDVKLFRALSGQQGATVVRARRLARDYGFKECGSTKSDAG